MILNSLSITNFKNIGSATLVFSPKINCLLGDNGMGKSNLLDAIYYLSFTKSYGRLPESMLIKKDEQFAIVNGFYLRNGEINEEISVALRRGARKVFKRGGKEYKRISEHIGLFPSVMIAPADQSLITGHSEERRRFIDMIISQADITYLNALIRYNQALEQRNHLLRHEVADMGLYESIEMIMNDAAAVITEKRAIYVDEMSVILRGYYKRICDDADSVEIKFDRSVDSSKSLLDAFNANRHRDRLLKHTSVGPHRDDLEFYLDGMNLKQTASQGQMKSFTIALKFAQYEFLLKTNGRHPLLLLDDIFDKLDAKRVENIVGIVGGSDFGQIFITDTNRKNLDDIMALSGGDYKIWNVENGNFKLLTDETD